MHCEGLELLVEKERRTAKDYLTSLNVLRAYVRSLEHVSEEVCKALAVPERDEERELCLVERLVKARGVVCKLRGGPRE